jgi:hypothetical protein
MLPLHIILGYFYMTSSFKALLLKADFNVIIPKEQENSIMNYDNFSLDSVLSVLSH